MRLYNERYVGKMNLKNSNKKYPRLILFKNGEKIANNLLLTIQRRNVVMELIEFWLFEPFCFLKLYLMAIYFSLGWSGTYDGKVRKVFGAY